MSSTPSNDSALAAALAQIESLQSRLEEEQLRNQKLQKSYDKLEKDYSLLCEGAEAFEFLTQELYTAKKRSLL